MRKRILLSDNIIGKPIEEANYADICFYDKEDDSKIIVGSEDFSADIYPFRFILSNSLLIFCYFQYSFI